MRPDPFRPLSPIPLTAGALQSVRTGSAPERPRRPWKAGSVATHPLWRPYRPEANAERQAHRVAQRQIRPGPLQPHQARWRCDYLELEALIAAALQDRHLSLRHVGSTAVPGLSAKPVIDLDLTVPDVADEDFYLPHL